MIGRLAGSLIDLDVETGILLLDVAGVGYEIEVSVNVLQMHPVKEAPLTLYTHLVVREDAQLLYGFANQAERNLFRGFIKISGVGPKLALALISALDPHTLVTAVRNEDVSALTRVPGVGKKTAERLMVELKNRLEDLTGNLAPMPVTSQMAAQDTAPMEAEDALVALGYRSQDASHAVGIVLKDATEELTTAEIIRRALRTFAQSGGGVG